MKTTIFQNGRSQAVRIPKEIALPDGTKEVRVCREGNSIVITPTESSWDDFFDFLALKGDETFPEREQPKAQKRDFGDWIE